METTKIRESKALKHNKLDRVVVISYLPDGTCEVNHIVGCQLTSTKDNSFILTGNVNTKRNFSDIPKRLRFFLQYFTNANTLET